jgi:hypothetical protein
VCPEWELCRGARSFVIFLRKRFALFPEVTLAISPDSQLVGSGEAGLVKVPATPIADCQRAAQGQVSPRGFGLAPGSDRTRVGHRFQA